MQTLDEIGRDYFPCTCGEIYLSRNLSAPDCPYHAFDWESAMQDYAKHIAGLAWDAGWEHSAEQMIDSLIEISNPKPTKEQFLNSIFNQP